MKSTLAEQTLDDRFIDELPEKLIGEKACDNDKLDERLIERDVALIAPYKSNRKKSPTLDERKCRSYKKKMEGETFLCLALQLPKMY